MGNPRRCPWRLLVVRKTYARAYSWAMAPAGSARSARPTSGGSQVRHSGVISLRKSRLPRARAVAGWKTACSSVHSALKALAPVYNVAAVVVYDKQERSRFAHRLSPVRPGIGDSGHSRPQLATRWGQTAVSARWTARPPVQATDALCGHSESLPDSRLTANYRCEKSAMRP